MSKVIIKGIKEDGKIDAECKSTAVLVTELIERLPQPIKSQLKFTDIDLNIGEEE